MRADSLSSVASERPPAPATLHPGRRSRQQLSPLVHPGRRSNAFVAVAAVAATAVAPIMSSAVAHVPIRNPDLVCADYLLRWNARGKKC